MRTSLFLYFGDNTFEKLNTVRSDPKLSNWNLSNVKIFSALNISNEAPIDEIYLGWSYVLFRIGKEIYRSGFCKSANGQLINQVFTSLENDEVSDVSCGFDHSFLLSKNKRLYSYDCNNDLLELNDGKEPLGFKYIITEDLMSFALTVDGKVYSLDHKENMSVKEVPINVPIKEIACGKEHAILLSTSGAVFSYGFGSRGQLGHGNIEKQDEPTLIEALDGIEVTNIAAGGWHSAAISGCGDLYMWGWNESGQLGLPCTELQGDTLPLEEIETVCCLPKIIDLPGEAEVYSVSCGSRHTTVLTKNQEVWSWGWNGYGQLGHTKVTLSDTPVQVQLPKNFHPETIKCKFWSTLISGYLEE